MFLTFWAPSGNPTVYRTGGASTSAWAIAGTDQSDTIDWEGLSISDTLAYVYIIEQLDVIDTGGGGFLEIATQPTNQTVTEPNPATFTVVATGDGPLTYQWRRNRTNIPGATSASYTLYPTAVSDSGNLFDVVITNDADSVTSASATLTVMEVTMAQLEFDTLTVDSVYVTVTLTNTYVSPVVVCSVQYNSNTTPVVPRVNNITSNSFDVRLQNPFGGMVSAETVSYLVVEEGVWSIDGVNIEAQTYQSTITDDNSSWVGETQSYGQSYTNPVVLGQVMTENDPNWSVFWTCGSSRTSPPTASILTTGKTVCEDTYTTRADETVGFIVFEAGHGTIGGIEFEASIGSDTVSGGGDSPPYTYSFDTAFDLTPDVAVTTMAGVDGGNGGWAYVHGSTLATTTSLYLSIDEDQINDSERNHTTEQVGYVVFGPAISNDLPIADNDTGSTAEDTPVTIDVLDGDTDADGDSLFVDSVTDASNGTVTNNVTDITYTPNADWNGTDNFTYTVSDGNGGTDTATVTVTVNSVNDDPVTDDDTGATAEDTPVTIYVLDGDTDVDGDLLFIESTTDPANGSVVNNSTDVTYTPDAGFNGSDTFSYTVSDGNGGTDIALVTVTVNSVNVDPVADNDTGATAEDTPVTIYVLDGDTDADGDSLSVDSVTDASNGTVTNNATDITYTPNVDWNGTDTFSYTVSDGNGGTDTATVTVTVNPVNDAPVADDQGVTTPEDTPVAITLTVNDTDGDSLSFIVTNPASGSLSGTAPNLTYTPNVDFYGSDSFSFTVNDGIVDSGVATVSVSVTAQNDPPVADDQAVMTLEDTPVVVTLMGSDLEGDTLTYTVIASPANGTLTGTTPNLTYTPIADFNGSDTFTFRANDGQSNSNTAAVTITVTAQNDLPVASDDDYSVDEGNSLTVNAPGVLGNDSDIDGDALTAALITGPANGTLTLNAGGSFIYEPDVNFTGTDSFTYKANDVEASFDEATVSISVESSLPPQDLMHVNVIDVTKQTWWILRSGIVTVQIVDPNGLPVAGATVYGQWSGGASNAVQFTTGSDGRGTNNSSYLWGDATFSFCVTNVVKESWEYDPDDNVITCETSN